jgi:hypothetical protein
MARWTHIEKGGIYRHFKKYRGGMGDSMLLNDEAVEHIDGLFVFCRERR